MVEFTVRTAEAYLTCFKALFEGNEAEVVYTMCHRPCRQAFRIHLRCLRLARQLNTRPARFFLRKWHEDSPRCEIIGKISHYVIEREEREQVMEFIQDLTRFMRHAGEITADSRANNRNFAGTCRYSDQLEPLRN